MEPPARSSGQLPLARNLHRSLEIAADGGIIAAWAARKLERLGLIARDLFEDGWSLTADGKAQLSPAKPKATPAEGDISRADIFAAMRQRIAEAYSFAKTNAAETGVSKADKATFNRIARNFSAALVILNDREASDP